MKRLVLSLSLGLVAMTILGSVTLAQPRYEFKLGFKQLAELIPSTVGQPTEEEHYGPNGDSLQATTTGLMAWRKADNWTAFTDGSRTWVNGPFGVAERANDERFPWEGPAAQSPPSTSGSQGSLKILAWNDLGMHCYNSDFQDLAVLPPYNTLWAQVVRAGNPPQIVTTGITIEYSFIDNSYSAGKTNFWDYEQKLFGVDLAPNVGLKGKGLSGQMEPAGDHFVAEGIPITEFRDSAPTTPYPYQLAVIVVRDAATGSELARTTVVAPVSSEMRCDNCHRDNGRGSEDIATGRVETNILALHDEESMEDYPSGAGQRLMDRRPILCAECHASNALGAAGKPGIPNLSRAMHDQHKDRVSQDAAGCYSCHPGPQTQCLRDVMSREGMTCIDCHGNMRNVAQNPNPWLNEPRCDSAACHGIAVQQDQPLYRMSRGHGGIYCSACHDSTHAIAPSRESNDGIKFMELQGHPGPLDSCAVCHASSPSGAFAHTLGTAAAPPANIAIPTSPPQREDEDSSSRDEGEQREDEEESEEEDR